MSSNISITVTPDVEKIGLKIVGAVFSDAVISNKNLALESKKKEVINKLKTVDCRKNPILLGYKELYKLCNANGFIPPAEHLIELIKIKGRLPNINTVVDSYNLVSIETFLSIGAHDLDKTKGDLAVKITSGKELYVPLGEKVPLKVPIGEYACMDDEKIICRMDVKQCEQTKITKDTKQVLIYLQGNKNTEIDYLRNALDKLVDYMKTFCKAEVINTF